MTRIWLVVMGVIATVGFAAIVLVLLPRAMLVEIEPAEALEAYSRTELRGRQVYIANGCYYCHSQQIRDLSFTTDAERGWGDRATVPADYARDRPALLGTMRTGPDLINVGTRLPDPMWHLIHLYNPRAVVEWSIMPAFPFLFEERDPADVGADDVVVPVRGEYAPEGRVVVATDDALALVDYLLSLRRGYPVPGSPEAREAGGTEPGEVEPAGMGTGPDASADDGSGDHTAAREDSP